MDTNRGQGPGTQRYKPTRYTLILCGLLFLLFGWVAGFRYAAYVEKQDGALSIVSEAEQQLVAVHIKGAVKEPAVYWLPATARVEDAITAAQPTTNADLSQLNLAAIVVDGSQIVVPGTKAPVQSPPDQTAAVTPPPAGKVNVNTATVDELMTLEGIGPVKAQRIVDYREKNGPYLLFSFLLEVEGINEATLEQIEDHICLF